MARPSLTRAHRALLGVVAFGACLISGIGFAGSYSAVRELALQKGFGTFSYAFPIGVDAGIVVLLALDLVLTWLRIPFPLLRQTAWVLTVATIAFNAAASWGDPLGMGMHAVIPVLFVVVVEASRHAVGRIAAISADRHMESVRLMRWLLSPVPTFRLWRRMKLWELRSYDEVVRLEQNRLVYRAQLRFRYGRGWRRSAPIQALLPLKLAKYGVPLDVTALDRLDPLPVAAEVTAAPQRGPAEVPAVSAAVAVPTLAKLAAARWRDGQREGSVAQGGEERPAKAGRPVTALRDIRAGRAAGGPPAEVPVQAPAQHVVQEQAPPTGEGPAGQPSAWFASRPGGVEGQPGEPVQAGPGEQVAEPLIRPFASAQVAAPAQVQQPVAAQPQPAAPQAVAPQSGVPTASAEVAGEPRRQELTAAQLIALAKGRLPDPAASGAAAAPAQEWQQPFQQQPVQVPAPAPAEDNVFAPRVAPAPRAQEEDLSADAAPEGPAGPGPELTVDLAVEALTAYKDAYDQDPDEERLANYLHREYGVTSSRRPGTPPSRSEMARIWPHLRDRYATLGRE
ncbi:hypothetical protein GCM10009665_57860 [Kitasatospora nipponensis]|uniref:DUF2637 domain-containing protein n=1 Tax=Kitasatospora nipponensis TaxID=258049 RepID=A0ABN1WQB1_9ACTN